MWRRVLFFIVILSFPEISAAQEAWAPLSSKAYATAIRQYQERTVPKRYAGAPEQRMYAEALQEKNKFLAQQLSSDAVIQEANALQRCSAILQRMQKAHPEFPFSQVQLYINRSEVANAACFGEGTLHINLGILLQLENDDELALLMGHELAHQFLGHGDSSLAQRIALEHSKDLKKEIRAIRKSSDARLEKLNSLKQRLAEVQGSYSRQKELEADSLGFLLAKSAGYRPEKAALLLLRLDASDVLIGGAGLYDLQRTFQPALPDYPFAQKPRYTGLSGVKVNLNANAALDSLRKTHPDCKLRYETLQPGPLPSGNYTPINLLANNTPQQTRLLKEQVRYLLETDQLSLAAHYSLLALTHGYDRLFFRNFLSAVFARLYAADKEGKRFETVTTYSIPGSTLQGLQNLLSALNREQIAALATFFLTPADSPNEAYAFARLAQDVCLEGKPFLTALQTYQQQFPQPALAYLLVPSGK